MRELLGGKGTKSRMAEVPKSTPRANFTFFFIQKVTGVHHIVVYGLSGSTVLFDIIS
jgi:hypothetical protein